MKKYQLGIMITLFFFGALLSACQKNEDAKKTVSQLVKKIEATARANEEKKLKKSLTIAPVVYQGVASRDPFEIPLVAKNVKHHSHVILKDVALDSLKLAGIVTHNHQRFAILRANDGKLYKMTEGMRVGLQEALLTQILFDRVIFTLDSDTVDGKKQTVVMMIQESAE